MSCWHSVAFRKVYPSKVADLAPSGKNAPRNKKNGLELGLDEFQLVEYQVELVK